jgi:hypothetical protein
MRRGAARRHSALACDQNTAKIASTLRFIRAESARGFSGVLREIHRGMHFNSRCDSIDALKNR